MSTPSPLPELPAWQARSFWITIIGAALQIAALLKFDLLGFLHVENSEALTDAVMQIVGAAALLWAWFERKSPKYQLSLSGKDDTTLRSPYMLGAGVLGLLLLVGCGANGRFKSPQDMTPAELCANAQNTVTVMKVTGAWPQSIIEAEKTAAGICAPVAPGPDEVTAMMIGLGLGLTGTRRGAPTPAPGASLTPDLMLLLLAQQ